MNHGRQAGISTSNNAILWNGSAGTAINLSLLLPTNWGLAQNGGVRAQGAIALDDLGNVFALAQDASNNYHVVEFVLTGQPASIVKLTNGHVFLQFAGVPNAVNRIEASPDLSPGSFMTIATITAGSTGTIAFEDPDAGTFLKRFYRLVSP